MSPGPESLVLNPNATISIQADQQPASFLVEAPIKGASFSSVRVCADNLPGAHSFLCSILIDGREDAQIGDHEATELRRIGLFAPADAIPQEVTYRFPLRDAARAGLARTSQGDAGVACPPGHSAACAHMPAAWMDQSLGFEPHHYNSVWAPVRIATAESSAAIGPRQAAAIESPVAALDCEATHAHFERERFAVIENLLPTEHVHELGRFFQALAAEGYLSCSEVRGSKRYVAHNHPVARFWHAQLNDRVSQLAGRRTRPSYSFVSVYLAGGDLFWHTDRPPCEYTLTLLLDYAPLDAGSRSPWALKLVGRDGTLHSIHQRIGEALIFKGRELKHGRDKLADGHRSVSLLFHFVDEDYAGEME